MTVKTNIEWIKATNYEEMSKIAAAVFKEQLQQNKQSVFGMATGGHQRASIKNLWQVLKQGKFRLLRRSHLT